MAIKNYQRKITICSHGGCKAVERKDGYCILHYSLLRLGKSLDLSTIPTDGECLLDSCKKKISHNGFCHSHNQYYLYTRNIHEYEKYLDKLKQWKKNHMIQHKEARHRQHKIRQLKAIRLLGNKCESCGEKLDSNSHPINLQIHHREYDESDKAMLKQYGTLGEIWRKVVKMSENGENVKKKFALLCSQCNVLEAWVRKDPKKAFETFAWLYGEGIFDDVLKEEKSLKKITEFIKP